jgi:uncharacterized protein YjiS (DUF1127 family)
MALAQHDSTHGVARPWSPQLSAARAAIAALLAFLRRAAAWPSRLLARVHHWRQGEAAREYLAGLSEHHLRDLGLARGDVARESAPPLRIW